MRVKILFIDCSIAGISGDMLLAGLLDLGADSRRVLDFMRTAAEKFPSCRKFDIELADVEKYGVKAKFLKIESVEDRKISSTSFREFCTRIISDLDLPERYRAFCASCVDTLIKAELDVHGGAHNVVLHELGSAETLAEIVGTAYALWELRIFENAKVITTPTAIGKGLQSSIDEVLPVPAPATLAILQSKKYPTVGRNLEHELTTPTGAALLVNLSNEISDVWPSFKPYATGYGAGRADFHQIPNILRVTFGERSDRTDEEELIILESNIDDITGEIAGYVLSKLIDEGAKDASIIPMVGKKGRPSLLVRVLTSRENLDKLMDTLISETRTLGVRYYSCKRVALQRQLSTISVNLYGRDYKIRVKLAKDRNGKDLRVKFEIDDIIKIARETKRPVQEIIDLLNKIVALSSADCRQYL